MKKFLIIILSVLYLTNFIYGANISNNFVGFNILYGFASLNYNNTVKSGVGGSAYYRSSFHKSFSYMINFKFEYFGFNNDYSESFYDVLNNRNITVSFNKKENFYNYSTGFLIVYTLFINEKIFKSRAKFLKNIYLDVSSGLIYSFIYKNIQYSYDSVPTNYISTEEKSRFLAPVLSLPIAVSFDYNIKEKWWILLGFSYTYMFYNDIDINYGINNIINIKLGGMYQVDFKL